MRKFLEALRRAFLPHVVSPLKIVAARQLHHRAALYVVDIDGRRLVFALAAHAVGLLASYKAPRTRAREEPATSAV